jgi:DHA3 family macrolide efflux protein-like MFS transporter
MRIVLEHRGLQRVFLANMISMMGSGLNTAAVTWYVLQKTGSEVHLSYLVMMQALPALVLLPFSGVFIDREDRRHIVMLLDAARGVVILSVAILALRGEVRLWHLYGMNILVAMGFWMFWPTITALIQELTPDEHFVHSNTVLMAGVQGGWLIAGSIVGFLYDHVGLGVILLIDVGTYVCSFLLYLGVRKGKHLVKPAETPDAQPRPEGSLARYFHELKEGIHYIAHRPAVIALGASWALFLGAMLTQGVITAPLSDRILHGGAQGYGWLNGAWGVGAFLSALYAARLLQKFRGRYVVAFGMAVLAAGMFLSPFAAIVLVGVVFFFLMGNARGLLGIALGSILMELVPRHMMGRVQNAFFFAGTVLQIGLGYSVGLVAHKWSLSAAFFLVGATYAIAFLLAAFPFHDTGESTPAAAD